MSTQANDDLVKRFVAMKKHRLLLTGHKALWALKLQCIMAWHEGHRSPPLALAYPAIYVIVWLEQLRLKNGWFGFCSQGGTSCCWIGLWCNVSDLMVEPSSIHTRVFLFLCNVVAPFKPDHCARRIVAMVLSSYSKLLLKHEVFSKQAWPSMTF
jgi:hypothetical protein